MRGTKCWVSCEEGQLPNKLSRSACSILLLSVFLDLIMLSYWLPEYWCHLIFSSGTDNSLQTSALGTPSFHSSSLCQLLFACVKNCLTNINSYINYSSFSITILMPESFNWHLRDYNYQGHLWPPQRLKSNLGQKCKSTYPLLRKKHLQLLVVLPDDPLLVLNQKTALRNLTFTTTDQIMDIFYFLVQLTKHFLENCQPAVSVCCIHNNLGHVILNLGKMQFLIIDRQKAYQRVTAGDTVL